MLPLGMVLLPVLIDPAWCRQQSSGPARWQTDGRGTLTASTEARFTGEVVMRCNIRVDQKAAEVLLQFEHVEVSFQPAGSRESGSGLIVEAEGARLEIIRVAGEDWIQGPHRAVVVPVGKGAREIHVVVRLVDGSERLPVRVDLRGLRVTHR